MPVQTDLHVTQPNPPSGDAIQSPLRLGIIGCGNVLDAYVPLCRRLEEQGVARLVMACGRPHQQERARRLGIPAFTVEDASLLQSPGIDGVIVLTSMASHARLATLALQAGKHVLVEKPMATSLREADALLDVAAKSPGVFVCAPFTVLSPTLQTMGRRIAGGDIGQPTLARARYGWAGPDWNDWFYKPEGGCLFDLGVYPVTSLTGLLGSVRRVTAFARVAIPERQIQGRTVRVEAEDSAQLLLEFTSGTLASITTGFTMQQYRSPALEVYGTQGTIQMLGDDWDPDGYELFRNSAGHWEVHRETHPEWSWADGLNHWVDCIRTRQVPRVTPAQARHVLEILVRAKESAVDGVSKGIETRFEHPGFEEGPGAGETHRQHDRTRRHE